MNDEPAPTFKLPTDDEHAVVVGRNGTGKSQLGAWLLSTRDLKAKPYFITDYKGEDLFNAIPRARHIELGDHPDDPGLYIVHGLPDDDSQDDMETWLWGMWERGNRGLFVDEGYMLPDNGAFQAILTQGRSKRIPVITLSQRPVKVSRFVYSEASHMAAFDLNDKRDRKTLSELVPEDFLTWLPPDFKAAGKLPKYHARWYSVKDDARYVLRPVPDARDIIAEIAAQLAPKKRWL